MNSLSHEQRQAVVRSIRQFAAADGGLERLPDECCGWRCMPSPDVTATCVAWSGPGPTANGVFANPTQPHSTPLWSLSHGIKTHHPDPV